MSANPTKSQTPPNIILITVDELRFPTSFPVGIDSADQFVATFMPNLYKIWSRGVVFTNFYTASAACSPARGTMVTGLYSQQTFMMVTRASTRQPQATSQPQPPLDPAFPTYGKVLREMGYDTPYIGKWHLSNCPADGMSSAAYDYLAPYGFQGLTLPDPLGLPGQGLGATAPALPPTGSVAPISDAQTASQAVGWLQARAQQPQARPFCLTIGFVNPHDKQFFWGGTEAHEFSAIYAKLGEQPYAPYNTQVVEEANPPSLGYKLPQNWETEEQLARSPKLHSVCRQLFDYITGGVWAEQTFGAQPTPVAKGKHKAVAPFSYWTRALDMYTQVMTAVDKQIGQVLGNIPPDLAANTVIVFTSDHGEYASSHGMQGKGFAVYQEGIRLPFVVYDPSGHFTRDTDRPREQLVSSVDLLPLLAALGHGGDDWTRGKPDYAQMYGRRANILRMLRDPTAPGRGHVVHATDEIIPTSMNYLHAPQHVIGLRVPHGKLGLYSHWKPGTTDIVPEGQETEYYDYATERGREETQQSPVPRDLLARLTNDIIPHELCARLPERYRDAQASAQQGYVQYAAAADASSILTAIID
jgi:arylsulfatase A-like enzyme